MREAGNVIDTSGGEATGPHSCVHDGEEGTRGRGWGGGAVDERRRRTTRMHRGTLVDARRTMFGSAFPAGERPTPVTPADSLTTTNEQSKGEKKKRKRDTAKPAVGRTTVRIIVRVEGGRGPSGRGATHLPGGDATSPPKETRRVRRILPGRTHSRSASSLLGWPSPPTPAGSGQHHGSTTITPQAGGSGRRSTGLAR